MGEDRRQRPGPKPGSEGARRRAAALRAKYGEDYFRQLGAKGGKVCWERRSLDEYQRIARLGGEALKQKYGLDHYTTLGSMIPRVSRRRGPRGGPLAPAD